MSSLQTLIELQQIDLQLGELEELLGGLPLKVEELKQQEVQLITAVEEGQVRLKQIKLELVKAEHHGAEINTQIDKLKDQLFLVTTNKQYDALMHEIDHLKEELDRYETQDIELMEEQDQLQEAVKSQELNLTSLSKDLISRRTELEQMLTESADKKRALEEQRQVKVTAVDDTVLRRYQRVRTARDGVAVVPVGGNACGGCGAIVPPQIVADIRANLRIHTCDVCSRILYWKK